MSEFSHLNEYGEANMVDVSEKNDTVRTATAMSFVACSKAVIEQLQENVKGDVLAVARVAGIQAAKQCSQLIPLCHPLPLHKVSIDFEITSNGVNIKAFCKTTGKTGIEMEALTAASISALTIYDMCKAVDKGMVIESTKLLEKTGGKSGDWRA